LDEPDRPIHLVPAVVASEIVVGEDENMPIGLVLCGIHLTDDGESYLKALPIDKDIRAT
jgi:hypothetical protein